MTIELSKYLFSNIKFDDEYKYILAYYKDLGKILMNIQCALKVISTKIMGIFEGTEDQILFVFFLRVK